MTPTNQHGRRLRRARSSARAKNELRRLARPFDSVLRFRTKSQSRFILAILDSGVAQGVRGQGLPFLIFCHPILCADSPPWAFRARLGSTEEIIVFGETYCKISKFPQRMQASKGPAVRTVLAFDFNLPYHFNLVLWPALATMMTRSI